MRKTTLSEVTAAYRTVEVATAYRDKHARSPLRRLAARAELRMVERAARHARLEGAILDAPCGTGRFLALAARCGAPVAADASPHMLAIARRARPDLPFAAGAFPHLPFPDRAFAGAICLRFLHHVAGVDRTRALAELARVTRGPIVASLFLAGNLQAVRRRRRDRKRGAQRRFLATREELHAAAAAAGLAVARVRSLCPGISALHVVTLVRVAPAP